MVLKQELDKMKTDNIKFYLSITFWMVFITTIIGYLTYEYITKSNSEIRYTVCEMVDYYSSSKDIGMKYQYTVNKKLYTDICTSNACANSKIGSKYIMKYWVSDPNLTEIYFDLPVEGNLEVPKEGWKKNPKNEKS